MIAGLLSPHPGKAAVERYWLLYTPVWGLATAVVMLGGFAETWGDVPCMAFGLALAAGAWIGPLRACGPDEESLPVYRRAGFKLAVAVTGLAFGLNYTQTPFFFDVLHMHYGFHTTWNIRNNPAFLYLVTVAYFTTYCVLCCMAFRALRRWGPAAWIVAPMAVAFLETALNANPWMSSLFCYDDPQLVLTFGTVAYGAAFVLALPLWMAIDETPGGPRLSLAAVLVGLGAVLYADLLLLDLLRYQVAPHLTTVIEGAVGLRDYAGSCLLPPSP